MKKKLENIRDILLNSFCKKCNDEYEEKFKSLPESNHTILVSKLEINPFHQGEFIIKEIRRNDETGKEYTSMTFIDKFILRRLKELGANI